MFRVSLCVSCWYTSLPHKSLSSAVGRSQEGKECEDLTVCERSLGGSQLKCTLPFPACQCHGFPQQGYCPQPAWLAPGSLRCPGNPHIDVQQKVDCKAGFVSLVAFGAPLIWEAGMLLDREQHLPCLKVLLLAGSFRGHLWEYPSFWKQTVPYLLPLSTPLGPGTP